MATALTIIGDSQTWQGGITLLPTQKLVINGTGVIEWGVGKYSQLEGGYPPTYPPTHHLDLHDLFLAPNSCAYPTWGLGLIIYPISIGADPGIPTGGTGSDAPSVLPQWELLDDGETRYWTLYPSDCFNASGDPDGWDVYFTFNDAGNWLDNVGDYELVYDVVDVSSQISPNLGRPGALTDEDRENGAYCERTGILTPGNRLREVSNRRVVERVAPWCNRDDPEG